MAWRPFLLILVVAVFVELADDSDCAEKKPLRPTISESGYDTEYRITSNGDVITLPARLGGRNCSFCFETGFTRSAFVPPWDSLLGPALREDTLVQISAAPTAFSVHLAPQFSVCSMTIPAGTEAYALQGRLADVLRLLGYRIDGMLGMSVLRHCVVQINFDRGTLKWLRTFTPTDEIPIRLSQAAPYLTPDALVTFPGFGFDRFTIDTGNSAANAASIEHDLFQRLENAGWLSTLEQRIAICDTSASTARFVKVGYLKRVADVDSMPLPECLFMDAGEGGANSLGMAFLRRFNLTFDFPKGVLYLKPRRHMDQPDRVNLSGLVVVRPAEDAVVHFVVPKSAADDAGVKAKDLLLRINGKEAPRLTWFEIQQELSGSGVTIPLTFRRDSRQFDVKFALPKITPPKRTTVDLSKKKFLSDDE